MKSGSIRSLAGCHGSAKRVKKNNTAVSVEERTKKLVIIGLPNTGKSQVFNNLTKEYALVANYPFTTVEAKITRARIGGELYEVIDTPGLHCLYVHSEEELIIRNMLFSENPDVIIQCIDANRLKQSLILTADLLELGIPMVIALNAIDETTKKGMWIDSAGLSRLLGVPVVESVAINGLGTDVLIDSIRRAKRGKLNLSYGKETEDGISDIELRLPKEVKYKRKTALLLLLNDPFMADYLKERYGGTMQSGLKEAVSMVRRIFRGNISRMINNKRQAWVDEIFEKVVKRHTISLGKFSKTVAQLSRHPVFGIPILLAVLFAIFFSVVNVANVVAGWMNVRFWLPIEGWINSLLPPGFWNDLFIGDYGILTLGVSNAILTVLPILSVFFLLFNTLEDIGYIPNLCVLLKRLSEKLGLSGSAIMPMALGFGCKTMATLMTKSLCSKRERYIAIYLVAFAIPCAAQMALNMSILGRLGVAAFAIATFVLVFVEITAGLSLNKILKKEDKSFFLQTLPDMRLPNLRAVIKKTYYKLWWFLREAMPIFVSAALVLFLADKIGLLDALKEALRPIIVGFLGFPLKMVDVLILCMAKHEAAAGMIIKLIQRGELNYVQCIVAVVITTMFVPCVANIVAMFRELGARRALGMIAAINISAFLIAGMLNKALISIFKP
jgi:ferrous iron transport protein B